ncbi:MAG: AraC family transcriptional regulator [Burkholderiaceae bacterium]
MDDFSNMPRSVSPRSSSGATPDEWAGRLSGPADMSSDRGDWPTALLRHWTNTSPQMEQPPLDHHYVVQHLGGAKRVERRNDGPIVSTVVEVGALTIVPAGTQFKWHTHGPIEFAHLYISPVLLAHTAMRFDRAHEISLIERVGCRDPLLEALYSEMILAIRLRGETMALYLDSLLEAFLLKLVLRHSSASLRASKARETLPAFRLNRVIDFVEAHLDSPLTLADLARVAGGSVFHFSRAFKNTAGDSPCQYVLKRRTARAKLLLTNRDLPLASVAIACGFHDAASFTRAFSRLIGITPARYRRE